MKKRAFWACFLPFLLILFVISCGSAPKPAETEPETPPPVTQTPPPAPAPTPTPAPAGVEQAVLDALADAKDSAAEARQRAVDFECPAYFPSDWSAAEQVYDAANRMNTATQAEAVAATAAFTGAAAAYNDIFDRTIPLYAQAREDEIMAARDALIATGLTGDYPEYINYVDGTALTALEQYEAKDYYAAKETAAKALYEYETLTIAAGIYLTREEILARGFDIYDPENFERADEVALASVDAAEAFDYDAAETYGEEAMLRYNLVLSNGWVAYASDRKNFTFNERERAIALKVNIAARELFREADVRYTEAGNALKALRYDAASSLFAESEERFAIAIRDTEEKRARADQAIRQAEVRIEQSDSNAINAERIIEGGR